MDGFFARPDVKNEVLGEHYDRFMKSGSFNILSTDPRIHMDSDLALDALRMQSFFVAPRNAAAGRRAAPPDKGLKGTDRFMVRE